MTKEEDVLDKLNDRVYRAHYAAIVWPEKFSILKRGGHIKSLSELCDAHGIDNTLMSRVLSRKRIPSRPFFEKVNKAIAYYLGEEDTDDCGYIC